MREGNVFTLFVCPPVRGGYPSLWSQVSYQPSVPGLFRGYPNPVTGPVQSLPGSGVPLVLPKGGTPARMGVPPGQDRGTSPGQDRGTSPGQDRGTPLLGTGYAAGGKLWRFPAGGLSCFQCRIKRISPFKCFLTSQILC